MNRILTISCIVLLALAAGCSDDNGGGGTTNNSTADGGQPDSGEPDSGQPDGSAPDGWTADEIRLDSIHPVQGPTGGGTEVTISGVGFSPDAQVFFGDDEAQAASFVSTYEISATTPSVEQAGSVDVVVEFIGGERRELPGAFEFIEGDPVLSVGWCNVQHPEATTTPVDTASEPIFGRVFVEGCSEADAHCEEVVAELGWGDPGVDPSDQPNEWTWLDANYNADHTVDNDDEYQAAITSDTAGVYGYAYRFSVDAGSTWTYCDLGGSDDGFDTAELGELTVEEETTPDPVDIGWCNLQHPDQTTTTAGDATELIYGRVYSENCTGDGQQCDGITAQLGFGPQGADPSTTPAGFTWTDASFNAGHDTDDNDEYEASLTPPNPGTYRYVYRFSGDDGATWTYCDRDGSDNGFQPNQMGDLTVDP